MQSLEVREVGEILAGVGLTVDFAGAVSLLDEGDVLLGYWDLFGRYFLEERRREVEGDGVVCDHPFFEFNAC